MQKNKDIWSLDFTQVGFGRTHTFHPKRKIGPSLDDQLIITLNKGFTYQIFVHEKDFFLLNTNGYALPFKHVKVMPDASDGFKFYYKMYAVQHIEKNVPGDPCVEDGQYSFTTCVKESLARKVGCRPSWDIWIDQEIRNCSNIAEHR